MLFGLMYLGFHSEKAANEREREERDEGYKESPHLKSLKRGYNGVGIGHREKEGAM
jgi:hypothetical protein